MEHSVLLQIFTSICQNKVTISISGQENKMQPKFLAYVAMAFGQVSYAQAAGSELLLVYCPGGPDAVAGALIVRI